MRASFALQPARDALRRVTFQFPRRLDDPSPTPKESKYTHRTHETQADSLPLLSFAVSADSPRLLPNVGANWKLLHCRETSSANPRAPTCIPHNAAPPVGFSPFPDFAFSPPRPGLLARFAAAGGFRLPLDTPSAILSISRCTLRIFAGSRGSGPLASSRSIPGAAYALRVALGLPA